MDRPTSSMMSEEGRLCRIKEFLAHSQVRVRTSLGQDCQDGTAEDGRSQAAGRCQVRLPTLDNESQEVTQEAGWAGTRSSSRGTPGSVRAGPSRTTSGTTSYPRSTVGMVDKIKKEFEKRDKNKEDRRVIKKGRRRNGTNGGEEGGNMVQSLIAQFMIKNKGGNMESSGRELGVMSVKKKRKNMEQCQSNGTGSSSKKAKTSQK